MIVRAALASTALLSIGFAFALLARHSAQDSVREETRIPGPHAIDGTMRVRLGGIEQSILLRGPGPDAPVLLYLHGGPGSPEIPIARTFDGELTKHFLVVHWDQRGSGKSFHLDIPTDSMTVEQLIRDTLELTDWLCERFGQEKIFLAGASWGGALGTYAVQRAPERFHAWVPMATLVHGIRGEELSYDYTRAKIVEAGQQEDLEELEAIGSGLPDSPLALARKRGLMRKYGAVFHNPEVSFWDRYGWASPDYSVLDVLRFSLGEAFSGFTVLLPATRQVDLFEQAPRLDVPVFMIHGRNDHNNSATLAREYFQALEAPRGKKWIWFEDSGHAIALEEPARLQSVLVEELLPVYEAWLDSPTRPSTSELGRWIERRRGRRRIPGLQVAVWHRGRVAWSQGFGVGDLKTRAPITEDTILRAGSISKLFTATLAMQLVERGKLGLDAPANTFLAPDRQIREPDGEPASASLRDLLSHRSGLPIVGSPLTPVNAVLIALGLAAVPEFPAYLAEGLTIRRPRLEGIRYSNDAFILIGDLVARIEGEDFSEVARTQILEPLGMRHSDFDPEVARTLGPWADVYQIEDAELVPGQELPGVWPSGSLHTTALDLVRFARMIDRHGTFGGRTVLGRNTVAEMLELQSRVVPGAETGFGLGFRVTAYRGSTAWCHEGANPGSSARLCALPERDLIVAVLLNRDDPVTRMEVTNEILRVFLELPPAEVRLGDAARWVDLIGHYEVLDPIPDVLPGLGWLADVEAVAGPAGLELRRGFELVGRLNPTDTDDVFELRGGIGDGELAYVRVEGGSRTEIRAAVFRMRRWPGGIRPVTALLGLASVGAVLGSPFLLRRLRRQRS